MTNAYNDLTLHIYDGTTLIEKAEYRRAQSLRYSHYYPGGFGDASFFLPGNPTYLTRIKHKHNVVITNGQQLAWAGRVTGRSVSMDQEAEGIAIEATGAWGDILTQQGIQKPWADTRINEDIWQIPTSAYNADDITLRETEKSLISIDRNNRIRFTPKAQAWTNGWYVRMVYTAPTGQTVKRVTANYNLQEGAQQWELGIYNQGVPVSDWSVTSTGTGSVDETLGTPSQKIWLYFQAKAGQTPPSDGSIYAEFSNIVVYTETGSINSTDIAKDIVGYLSTDFSSNVSLIGSNTYSLVPFVADPLTYAAALTESAKYGDASYNPWAFGVRSIDASYKPILYYEQQPDLTVADYTIELNEQQLRRFEASQRSDTIRNWIAVGYRTEQGYRRWVTPDDDATLTDATSVAAYGERQEWISIDTESSTTAINYGRSYLAKYKDLQWSASNIPITGYINRAGGGVEPASLIYPGKVLRISNYLGNINGVGLSLLITGTDYDDATQTNTLTVGKPDALDAILARIEAEKK